ncbi:MAG: CDP-glycerol glycerophosphotransferase family protein [Bacteroidetes bacterium]|nr:CDP-glycerol glycerophosphotransferase family protein [Bacteroidota bacterium]
MENKRCIFISLPAGSHFRDIVKTGVLSKVSEKDNVRFIIVTPFFDDRDYRNEFPKIEVIFEKMLDVRLNRLGRKIYSINDKKLFIILLRSSEFFAFIWRNLLSIFLPISHYRRLLKNSQPHLVVITTAHKLIEVPILIAANLEKIKNLCLLASWDNLQYSMGDRPKHLVVWNNEMVKVAVQKHKFRSNEISVVGPPHFDFFFMEKYHEERNSFFKRKNLDQNKRLITMATSPPSFTTDNTFLIDLLLKGLEDRKIIQPVQFLCRVHPLDDQSLYKKYESDSRLILDIPISNYNLTSWKTSEEGLLDLISSLKYSDVIINVASTITIEAAVFGTPVINIAFSNSEPERFRKQILIRHHQFHYKAVIESEGARLASNEQELFGFVNSYLEDRSLDEKGRKNLVNVLTNSCNGNTASRLAAKILEHIV